MSPLQTYFSNQLFLLISGALSREELKNVSNFAGHRSEVHGSVAG